MEGEVGAHSARILKHFAKYQVFKISIFLDISGPLRMSPAEAGHRHPPSWLRALWSSLTWCLHKYPGDSKLCYLIVRCYYQVVIAFASEKTWCLVYHKSYDSSIKDANDKWYILSYFLHLWRWKCTLSLGEGRMANNIWSWVEATF